MFICKKVVNPDQVQDYEQVPLESVQRSGVKRVDILLTDIFRPDISRMENSLSVFTLLDSRLGIFTPYITREFLRKVESVRRL